MENRNYMNNIFDMTSQSGEISVQSPLISIIIPVYNAAQYIKKCLLSIITQQYKNLQVICVDDGSTDNSLSIIKEMANYDKRIIYTSSQNKGPAHARNTGLNMAQGEYVSFVDADDFVEDNIYTYLVDVAETNQADLVAFGGWPYPNNNTTPEWISRKMASNNAIYEGQSEVIKALFSEENSRPFLWLHFIRRKLFEMPTQIRFNEEMDLGEDQAFQFEYFPRAKKVVFTDKRLYTYRWSQEGSLMWTYNNKRLTKFEKHILLVETVFKNWNKSGYSDIEGYLPDWAINFLYYDLKNLPKFFQCKFAKRIVDIASMYDHNLYMCSEQLYDKATEIVEMSQIKDDYETILNADMEIIKNRIESIEEQIQTIIKSKTFKYGRIFTRKKDRINIESILPPNRKKN